MKQLKRIFLLALAALAVLPLAAMERGHDVASEINNAMLTELDLSGGLSASNVNAWLADRVGFRTEALTAHQALNSALFGQLEHPNYDYGEDGYVFFKFKPSYNSVDADFLDAFCAYLRQMQDYCEARGVPFLYAVSPSKTEVYAEYLPEGCLHENVFYPALYERLEHYGVHYTSNLELLREKAETEQVFNRQYDAGHWNDLGAFYAVNDLLEAIHEDFPAVRPWTMEDFDASTKEEPFLSLSRLPIHETVPVLAPHLAGQLESISGFSSLTMHPSHQHRSLYRRTDAAAQSLPRVLMFHGSYYNRNPTYYACAFREAYGVHNYQNILNLPYYFNVFQPEYVIVSSAQYATTRNYFDYDTLCSIRLNAPLETVLDQPHETLPLSELSPETATEERLTTISFRPETPAAFGYLVTADGTELDLTADLASGEEGALSCTVDNQRVPLDGALVYLFPAQS